jgi:hypothetical protein
MGQADFQLFFGWPFAPKKWSAQIRGLVEFLEEIERGPFYSRHWKSRTTDEADSSSLRSSE